MYETLRQAVNDPGNTNYWLPTALDGLDASGGGKLLPLHEDDWSLGAVTGEPGATFRDAIKTQWWTTTGLLLRKDKDPRYAEMREHQPIACPDQPWPAFALSDVTVNGLDNVYLLGNPVVAQAGSGYSTTLTLRFGYYTDRPGLVPVQVQGRYSVQQCVCSAAAPDGTTCDGFIATATVAGSGDVQLTLSDMWVDADVSVSVAGSGATRTQQIVVTKLAVRGSHDAWPQIAVDELTIATEYQGLAGLWKQAAINALTSDAGRTALTQNLDAALNGPDFLQTVSGLITTQFGRILDANLGPVPAGGLPAVPDAADNPADAYLFDRLRVALNDPASDYYLPKVVTANTSPVLDPLSAGALSLGPLGQSGIQFSDVTLTGVVLEGLSNIQAPIDKLQTVPAGVQATLVVGGLNPPPTVTVLRGGVPTPVQVPAPPLRITGGFACTLQGYATPLTGTFTVTATNASIFAAMNASGADVQALQVAFLQLQLQVALFDFQIQVQIDSVFQDVVNQIFNSDAFKQKVLQAINDQLAARRAELGDRASDAVRHQIEAKIGG